MLPRPLWMQRQSLPLSLHIRANQPGFAAQLQQPLDLHVQKGNALRRAVTFPEGGQGDVFVAGYLVIHLHSTSLDCSLYMEKALKVQSIQRRN